MLEKELSDYIDGLKISHPGLDDATIRATLSAAEWSETDITAAIARYKEVIHIPAISPASAAIQKKEQHVQPLPEKHTPQEPITEEYIPEATITAPVSIPHTATRTIIISLGVTFLCLGMGLVVYVVYTNPSFFDQIKAVFPQL
jgi:hypothetical protein